MAELLLFHHVQGLTDGVLAFAGDLRVAGHTVHTPDLFDGRIFRSKSKGREYVEDVGHDVITQRGLDVAQSTPADQGLVYGGISFGVEIAQRLAQTTPTARGALLLESFLPVDEHSTWPSDLPAQIHGMDRDKLFEEGLASARALAERSEKVELFVYPGDVHHFSDPSLDTYEPRAYAQLLGRTLAFLARV